LPNKDGEAARIRNALCIVSMNSYFLVGLIKLVHLLEWCEKSILNWKSGHNTFKVGETNPSKHLFMLFDVRHIKSFSAQISVHLKG
jgi:hypothetical protein